MGVIGSSALPDGAPTYVERLADAALARNVEAFPAVMVVGPRASGKTTTAQHYARSVVRMDREAEAAAFRADPDAALRGLAEPALLDEWQEVPAVLGAVKRAVDAEPRPGRFLLTGSISGDVTQRAWPGTGRVIRIPMWGLTMREIGGRTSSPSFLAKATAGTPDAFTLPADVPDLRGYVELALRSGFPEAVLRTPDDAARRTWLSSYVDQLVMRDIHDLGGIRDAAAFRRYVTAVALSTAGVVQHKTLYEAAGIDRKTAERYDALLAAVFVTESVPAWWSNRLKRLTKAAKRYLVDAGLVAGVVGVDPSAVMRDGDLLGRVLDTFVAAQLRPELTADSGAAGRLHHLRTGEGRHEIDLVVEVADGRLVGVEVKATAAPGRGDAAHLGWLRDELGEKFAMGILAHTGPRVFTLDERILAVPIAALWG